MIATSGDITIKTGTSTRKGSGERAKGNGAAITTTATTTAGTTGISDTTIDTTALTATTAATTVTVATTATADITDVAAIMAPASTMPARLAIRMGSATARATGLPATAIAQVTMTTIATPAGDTAQLTAVRISTNRPIARRTNTATARATDRTEGAGGAK